MFKCGYCSLVVHEDLSVASQLIDDMKRNCEKAILGIPDELTYARLFGDFPYSAEATKERILKETNVDDVFIFGEQIEYQEIYEKLHFDALYYGSCFGRAYNELINFAEDNQITMLSLIPDRLIDDITTNALTIALENMQRSQKIVLFGTGTYFDIYLKRYGNRFPPAYAIDNNSKRWGTKKSGIEVFAPEKLQEEKEEDVLIIICAKNYQCIVTQLKEAGDYDYRLMLYSNLVALLEEYALVRRGELEYLKKTHTILADMLKEFDRICKKYQLHYYMICGSLIGVLRHQGFIPWDDDVDVAMPREDYDKLRKIAAQEWQGSFYRVLGINQYGNGAFLDCMPRVVNMRERLPMKVYDKVLERASEDIVDRPFLDIYVMDNAFDNDKKHMFIMNMMKGVYNLLMGHRGHIDYDEYRARMPEKTIRLMKALHTVGRFLPLSFLLWWYDHLSKKANNKVCENFFMPSCAITCIERKFKKAFFREGIRKPFIDFEVTVPSDYDGLMEAMNYHGYMQFPRMSIRKPSHYFNSDIIIW